MVGCMLVRILLISYFSIQNFIAFSLPVSCDDKLDMPLLIQLLFY